MEATLAAINATLTQLCGKIDSMERNIYDLRVENSAVREELAAARKEIAKKDEAISKLTDQVNRIDQASRANTIRIFGLPITNNTHPSTIPAIVFNEIITPIMNAAREAGDIPPNSNPLLSFTIDQAFAIPSKNATSTSVVVKLASHNTRQLIFKHKKAALPQIRDLTSNKVRCQFAIFEDLSPANHSHFKSLSADHRVKNIWTHNGQIRLRLHDGETVYRVKDLKDTVDSLTKTPAPSAMSP
jgi:hypothetical protein